MKKQRFRAIDITYVAMFAALMAIGANATSFITIGPVPLTLQTFFAILAGALLGSRLGSMSMIVYTLVGLVGAPVFAQMTGTAIITKSTFGFVLSFIIVAYVTGKIVEAKGKPTLPTFFIACFVGLVLNYVIGTTYMFFALKYFLGMGELTYVEAWSWMVLFLYKDLAVTVLAAILCPKVYKAVNKSTQVTKSAA
ncbi:biotin transporter BioY [Anaerobacillus alkaliphilus]|uniref:Biotin transporter n=1 Tax=Anaerobacillus alkaliphilus TaxID=1548597 RepID=A0A4Q0VWH3_9BACI|nr:biotin transporter BioY [Anaerobacillus alkaliphilus]RXJ01850.1 biotin transporter BioY [Anaerobacillus alkaliphilus]